mmetsp:Transcript_9967/g.12571  ORF Transcript_9967/g.12571 Transcript_9967/m.12571 type:complete len:227 (+) Transcript_9967:123-803(+)
MLVASLYQVIKYILSAIFPITLLNLFHSSALSSSWNTIIHTTDQQEERVQRGLPDRAGAIIKGSPTCPGSQAYKNAKCSMIITFPRPTPCNEVLTEITSRMNGENGWTDPHNQGTYTILNTIVNDEEQMTQITGSRVTGDGKYTDMFIFTLEEDVGGGCILSGCSESQVFSVLDFSTNYCNLRNLYCNSKDDGCPISKYNLSYEETYVDCWQRDATKCVVTTADAI